MRSVLLLLAGAMCLSAILLLTVGCAKTETETTAAPVAVAPAAPVVPVPPPPPRPVVYLLHGSPDAPALDIYMGGTLVANDLGFGGLAGPMQLTPTVHSFDLFSAGPETVRPAMTPLSVVRTPDLVLGQQYLAVVAGYLTSRSGQQPLQMVVYPVSFASSPSPVLRLVHTLAGAPPLQAGVVQNAAFLSPLLITSVAFAGASQAAGTGFPAGPVQVGLSPVGAVSPVATFAVNASPGMRAFLVPIGSLSPASGDRPIRLAVINVSNSPWTVAVLEPQ